MVEEWIIKKGQIVLDMFDTWEEARDAFHYYFTFYSDNCKIEKVEIEEKRHNVVS